MGKISRSEPRHRICYEYADHGDFWDLISWYDTHRFDHTPYYLHVFFCGSRWLKRKQPYSSGSVSVAYLPLHGERPLLLLLWDQ